MELHINQNIKMPIKGRKALACSKEEFLDLFKKLILKTSPNLAQDSIELGLYELDSKIHDDTDIEFDCENIIIGWEPTDDSLEHAIDELVIDGKSVSVLKLYAGGDWEYPVYLVGYFDDKKRFRFYAPKPGNTFNSLNKSAFGNDEDLDDEFAQKYGFSGYSDANEEWDCFDELLEPDFDLLEQAVKARLIAC